MVPSPYSLPVVLSSAHGLVEDADLPSLILYTAAATFPSCVQVPNSLFLACSTLHFGEDIGFCSSLLLHSAWVWLLLSGREGTGWTLFTMYYTLIHSLPTCFSDVSGGNIATALFPFTRAATILSSGLVAVVPPVSILLSTRRERYLFQSMKFPPLIVGERMKRGICVHCVLPHIKHYCSSFVSFCKDGKCNLLQ